MTYVIAEPCVDVLDKACIEECPVEAIFYEDDLPDKWREYTQANVDFFNELGSPGGASKVGKTANDPAFVMALPQQSAEH